MGDDNRTRERIRLDELKAAMPHRDALAIEMFAAWVNVPPSQLPGTCKQYDNPATMDAWGRVAEAAKRHLEGQLTVANERADRARDDALRDMLGPIMSYAVYTRETLDKATASALMSNLVAVARSRMAHDLADTILALRSKPPLGQQVPRTFLTDYDKMDQDADTVRTYQSRPRLDLDQLEAILMNTALPAPGSRWRHLTSGGVYEVVECAVSTTDLEAQVIYKAVDGPPWMKWSRPSHQWTKDRFKLID